MNKILRSKIRVVALGITYNDKGEILMTRRHSPKTPYSHNKWQIPGGTIEFGEDPAETAKREVKEETGIDIFVEKTKVYVVSHVFEESDSHVLLIAFLAKYLSGDIDTSNDLLTSEAKWYTYNEIDFSMCLPKTKYLIDESRKSIIHDS